MNRAFLPAAAAGLLALAGCSFGGKAPPELLTLSAASTQAMAQPRTAGQGNVVTVTVPTTPHVLANNRVAVYTGPTSVQYLKEGVWADKPGELFRLLLSETLAGRSGWVVVDPSVYTQVQGVVLGGQLLRFGYDPARGEAVVLFEASLARPEKAVTTNRFEARVPAAAADGAAVAAALNQAANQVAAPATAGASWRSAAAPLRHGIPAFAGMTEGRIVAPAKAGASWRLAAAPLRHGIPAFAGMTEGRIVAWRRRGIVEIGRRALAT